MMSGAFPENLRPHSIAEMAKRSLNPKVSEIGRRVDDLNGAGMKNLFYGLVIEMGAYFAQGLLAELSSIPGSSSEEVIFRNAIRTLSLIATPALVGFGALHLASAAMDSHEANVLSAGLMQYVLTEPEPNFLRSAQEVLINNYSV